MGRIAGWSITCHDSTEYQKGEKKRLVNGRGEEARLDGLSNPESRQILPDGSE